MRTSQKVQHFIVCEVTVEFYITSQSGVFDLLLQVRRDISCNMKNYFGLHIVSKVQKPFEECLWLITISHRSCVNNIKGTCFKVFKVLEVFCVISIFDGYKL